MSEERQKERKLFHIYVPDSKKESFELYKKLCKAMGLSLSERLVQLALDQDLLLMLEVIETLKNRGEKKDVKEN
jgi:hypothetical protein